MTGRRAAALGAILVALALLVAFGIANRGTPLTLTFGVARWRGDAVIALYGAVFVGLAAMFLLSLPADVAAERERERLARRVRTLEREAVDQQASTDGD